MSWKLHDEAIDLVQGQHTVIFKNSDTGMEHHVINIIGIAACPTCGRVQQNSMMPAEDFQKLKDDTLTALNAHHKAMLAYRAQHSRARLITGSQK